MRPAPLTSLLLTLLSVSCAPRVAPQGAQDTFHAAFSPEGVAWVSGGRACVARAPSFRAECPVLGRAVDVAWNGGDAWAAVPLSGQVYTLDRAARSVTVGAAQLLSSRAIYRQDGSVLNYQAGAAGDIVGFPQEVLTGGDGLDYVRVNGQVRRAGDGALVDEHPATYLVSTPDGVTTSAFPAVVTANGTYRVTAEGLEWLNLTGQRAGLMAGVTGRVGLVGEWVVTVSPEGVIRVFGPDLKEITR